MATRPVLIGQALAVGSALRPHVRNGLGALSGGDRGLIAATERPRVGDSLNLDLAMQPEFPEAHRWDYLLSIPNIAQIVGVEPHTARDDEINVVISKRRNAVDYLRDHLPAHHRVSQWYWLSSGPVRFSKMERARRLLDQNGIRFEGRMLRSFG